MAACPECGVDEAEISAGDGLSVVRSFPRRFREAMDVDPGAVTMRGEGSADSMLESAATFGAQLEALASALPVVIEHASPKVPALPIRPRGSLGEPADVLRTITDASAAFVQRADAVPTSAWSRPFELDGTVHEARYLVQRAAHLGAHGLKVIERTRAALRV